LEPFPFPDKKWRIVVVPSIWVFLIVYLLEPLEIVNIQNPHKIIITIAMGMFTGLISALVIYVFPYIFKNYFNPDSWNRGKFFSLGILISTLSVAPITFFLYIFYTSCGITFYYIYFERTYIWLPAGLFVGLGPTLILYIWTLTDIYKSQISSVYNTTVKSVTEGQHENTIAIPKNAKEDIIFPADNFLYAETQGNYLTIHYLSGNEIMRETIRLTLSQLMSIIDSYENIMRCHRAFLVNLSYVVNMKKKDQKFVLLLNNCSDEIPISKTYRNNVVKALHI